MECSATAVRTGVGVGGVVSSYRRCQGCQELSSPGLMWQIFRPLSSALSGGLSASPLLSLCSPSVSALFRSDGLNEAPRLHH